MLLLGTHLLRLKKNLGKNFKVVLIKIHQLAKSIERLIKSGKKVQNHVPTLSINDEVLYDTKNVANASAKNISDISKRLIITIIS